ncbi:MAG: porin family protein [Prevotella sp.]|jgi:opacity protein-like surface antigen
MKKFTLIVLLFAMMASAPAVAQIQYGVKGGLNLTSLHYTYDDYDDMSNQVGFSIGPTLKMGLTHGLGIDAALMYDRRSAEITPAVIGGPIYSTTITQQQLVVPVNLRYDLNLSQRLGAFIFAGPQVGFQVGDSSFKTAYGDWELKKAQLSVNMGLGVTLSTHWQVTANYNLAGSKTADIIINQDLSDDKTETVGDGKMSAWQISLGYYF